MHRILEEFASAFGTVVGTSWAFLLAMLLCIAWLAMGGRTELYGVSRITVVEFANMFMFIHLFLIQRIQNKNLKALHLKLDELIASKDGANNKLIKAERIPEDEIEALHEQYVKIAEKPKHSTAAIGTLDDTVGGAVEAAAAKIDELAS
jgi:low affinity Fe/Cu permease